MIAKRLVVIGASSGGIDALRSVIGGLPADLPAAVCLVLHSSPKAPGVLPDILSRCSALPVLHARTGMRIETAHVYVAPPNRHLLVEPGTLSLTNGPRENLMRPAIDPLFRSAAAAYGPAAIGVILTGDLDDGTAGLWAIKQLGGIAIVQSPQEAEFPSMPRHAAAHVDIDFSLRLREIAPRLMALVSQPPGAATAATLPESVEVEVDIAREHNALAAGIQQIAEPSSFSCPECRGVLLRLREGKIVRFRCHTGHAYSATSLIAAAHEAIEQSIWTTVRTCEEAAMLFEELAVHAEETHGPDLAAELREQSAVAHQQAETIRALLASAADTATGPIVT